MESETPGGPVRCQAARNDGRLDVVFQCLGMAEDRGLAGVADGGVGGVGFLHHGADEASVFGFLTVE